MIEFRPSIAEDINKAPLVAIAGPTGCGKTESAMRLARGFVGPTGKFCVIDTEERRALYKKARYQPWDHLDLKAPYSPEHYTEALEAALAAHYGAVIVDSWSHEWSGEGGVSESAEEETARIVERVGLATAEKMTALAWAKPKARHKKLVNRLILRYPALLIFCLRSESKIKYVKDVAGKTKVVDAGFQPICEKGFMFDMLVACKMESLETDGKPGVPLHIKQLEPDLEPVFPKGQQITEETGKRLAAWAAETTGKPRVQTAATTTTIAADAPLSDAERRSVAQFASKGGHDQSVVVEFLKATYGVSTTKELRREHLLPLLNRLKDPRPLTEDMLQPPPENAAEPDAGANG